MALPKKPHIPSGFCLRGPGAGSHLHPISHTEIDDENATSESFSPYSPGGGEYDTQPAIDIFLIGMSFDLGS